MIRRPPRSTLSSSSAASDVYKRQYQRRVRDTKRSSAKQNYMYLSDSHPDDSRIGIGMGGESGSWSWFIDKWLETGSCNQSVEGEPIQRCPTFNSLVLSPTMTWTIGRVDAFAVEPGMVGKLREERGDYTCLLYTSPSPRDS
eukprot:TRINITY_DN21639_c0_g1_i2.p1 TRINITY_DN21639_c0_g1~~TRINITY_DN21639_c0_g1_i2.p1  ORF type:complete len:142 (-),score=30.82 TRINITY_DN21639_c0_g1_i2:117-542(-)